MPPAAATYRVLPSMIPRLLNLRLTGLLAIFLVMFACSRGRHLNGTALWDFASSSATSGVPVSSNDGRCSDLPGAFVDYPAGFGLKAHRPPNYILGRVRMLSGMAFQRHGSLGPRGQLGNLRRPILSKCWPLP